MTEPKLYPKQQEGVDRFLESKSGPPGGDRRAHRLILAWGTGVGKTAGAWSAANALRAERILIVCPAIVRPHWRREAVKWAPFAEPHVIEQGRKRKLSVKASAARDAAYAAAVEVVSYDLVGQVNPEPWDLIILDELHNLANPLTKQSRMAASLLKANPHAHVLGLTATPIPTRVSQLWHPLYLLFGPVWGKPAPNVKDPVSWDFKFTYCDMRKDEFGWKEHGARESAMPELHKRLQPVMHVATREDIRNDMPPLDVGLYEIPRNVSVIRSMMDWVESLGEDVTHIVVLTHLRRDARNLADKLNATAYVDGSVPTGERDKRLQACAAAPRALLIGTHESLSEGVRLMWPQQVAVLDWSASPGTMLQLLGRFQSVGSDLRPRVNLMVNDTKWGLGVTLLNRLHAGMAALGSDPRKVQLAKLMDTATSLSDADTKQMWDDMLDTLKPDDWSDDDDD